MQPSGREDVSLAGKHLRGEEHADAQAWQSVSQGTHVEVL